MHKEERKAAADGVLYIFLSLFYHHQLHVNNLIDIKKIQTGWHRLIHISCSDKVIDVSVQ